MVWHLILLIWVPGLARGVRVMQERKSEQNGPDLVFSGYTCSQENAAHLGGHGHLPSAFLLLFWVVTETQGTQGSPENPASTASPAVLPVSPDCSPLCPQCLRRGVLATSIYAFISISKAAFFFFPENFICHEQILQISHNHVLPFLWEQSRFREEKKIWEK